MTDEEIGRARAMAWGLRTIADLHGIQPREVLVLLAVLWQAWEAHPDFERVTAGHELRIWNPHVLAAFRHEPGLNGFEHSYIIGPVQDVVARLEWGARTFGGTFVGFRPLRPWMPVSRYYVAMLSYSYHGAGGAMWCRKNLRALLPARLHRYITLARRFNRRPKRFLAPADPLKPAGWLPESYRSRTKAQIFLDEVIEAEDLPLLRQYMAPPDFWRAATGRMHPDEVADHVLHQPGLLDEQPHRVRASARPGGGRRGRRPIPPAPGQLPIFRSIDQEPR